MARFAYFPPGQDKPWGIYESMESVTKVAKDFDDDFPNVRPVKLGALEVPDAEDIRAFVLASVSTSNPHWEKGWDDHLRRLRKHIDMALHGLAARLADFNKVNPGYVVDERDLEHIKAQLGVRSLPDVEVAGDEEE